MGLIAGIYSREKDLELVRRLACMISVQTHRDINEPVTLVRDNIVLGMANKHDAIFCEPDTMKKSGNSTVHAFVDGVVLDIPEHKEFFESAGCSISEPTGSSIVAAAYEKWGIEFMKHLDGDFSCAVWDEKNQILILSRDPYGKKPLHYYCKGGEFVFSSEIKGILKAGIYPHIDLVSLSDFLSLNNFPNPETLFKDILQVPPGCNLIFMKGNIKLQKYWYPTLDVDPIISLEQAVSEIEDTIRTVIRKRMVAKDVYCFLSGGVDSSLIVSFAAESSGNSVHAVSVGFADEEFNELDDASLMAKHVGAVHHPVIAEPNSFFDMLDLLVHHHDAPFTDVSSYPTYYAAKMAGNLTDIILTGDGPDQIMCGSGHYIFAAQQNIFAERNLFLQKTLGLADSVLGHFINDPTPGVFSKIRRKLYRESMSPVHAAYDIRSYFPDIVKRYLCTDDLWAAHTSADPFRHPESWFHESKGSDDTNRYLFADMAFYLPDDLMVKVDRMCMAHGLETLSPFLDKRITGLANKLPGRYKLHRDNDGQYITKHILRKLCQKRFPPGLLQKKKQGFGIPLGQWLKQNQGKYVREILLDPLTLKRGYFKKESLEKLLDVFLSGRGDYFFPAPRGIVGLLTLELWHRKYLDQ